MELNLDFLLFLHSSSFTYVKFINIVQVGQFGVKKSFDFHPSSNHNFINLTSLIEPNLALRVNPLKMATYLLIFDQFRDQFLINFIYCYYIRNESPKLIKTNC